MGCFLIGECNIFTRCVGVVILAALLAHCPSTFAQSNSDDTAKWELQVFSGFPVYNRTAGSSALPPPGPFYTVFIRPLIYASRRVPSWFFGDGTNLFNAAADEVGSVPKITPLDPLLTSSVVQPSGASVGLRLSRHIKRWASAELSVERSGSFTLSERAQSQIEASRNSYVPAFKAVTLGPSDSQSTIKKRGGFMALSTGALVIHLPGYRRLEPFVSAGGGALHTGGNTPNATLIGTYDPRVSLQGLSDPITDTVHLDFAPSRRWSYVSVFGGGFKIPIKGHFGVAVESRAYIYDNPMANSLSANYTTPQTFAFIVAAVPAPFAPSVFLSTIPPGTLVGAPPGPPGPLSSLSAPPISGFKSFTESGLQRRVIISIGPFWRF